MRRIRLYVPAAALLLEASACNGGQRSSAGEAVDDQRAALAATFVAANPGTLAQILHDSVIVQPPRPDSALQGPAAISYLRQLARHTQVRQSWLSPTSIQAEGPFLLEQGLWLLQPGERFLRASYMVRWRPTPEGWKVGLLRWGLFR